MHGCGGGGEYICMFSDNVARTNGFETSSHRTESWFQVVKKSIAYCNSRQLSFRQV